MRQTRQAFDQFFDLVPDLMCVVSIDGRLCRVNDAWQQILGFSREELVSRHFSEFLHPEDVEPTQREIAQRAEGDRRQRFVNRYRTRWGDYRWIEWRSVLGEDGYLYAGGRDITEQRATEDQLKKEADRNAVLLKELRHRVKNSLSAVSGLLSIGAADGDGHSRQVLREAQGRVETIIQVYESLHRTDPGSEVDLGRYVEDLARVVTTANNPGDTKLELRVTVDSFSAEIGEVFPIGLILNELLTNVLKYAYGDEPYGVVDVGLYRRESSTDINGVLQVTDYGTGFPAGFELGSAAGTGLMLVRSLVEQLDGTVQLDGSQGNTVRVTFPLQ